jgi:hypothetical protein
MFTVDPKTHMAWFLPGSIEPLERFELLGILFSLAVFNGITLPVTFPMELYRHLLGVSTYQIIDDGWPQLRKAFDELLNWKDGDVGDVFMRTYEFSFEAFGKVVSIDMECWPSGAAVTPSTPAEWLQADPTNESLRYLVEMSGDNVEDVVKMSSTEPRGEANLVTNENRVQYVQDYIHWLTYQSIAPQLGAFKKGFYACFDQRTLSLLDPPLLRKLIQGYQTIDIQGLQGIARYEEGYTPSSPIIRHFWSIVSRYDDEMKKKLLEFVTASDRVPVSGTNGIMFSIVRNGSDSENLPTSSTCFGKLLLPEYDSKEKLEKKLNLALMYSRGFGVV